MFTNLPCRCFCLHVAAQDWENRRMEIENARPDFIGDIGECDGETTLAAEAATFSGSWPSLKWLGRAVDWRLSAEWVWVLFQVKTDVRDATELRLKPNQAPKQASAGLHIRILLLTSVVTTTTTDTFRWKLLTNNYLKDEIILYRYSQLYRI